ncbi:transposase [Rhodococcus sp. 2H158]
MLTIVAPQPARSGRTTGRHGLSRSGDRAANSVLHIVTTVRTRHHRATRDYVERHTAEGLSNEKSSGASSATSPARSTGIRPRRRRAIHRRKSFPQQRDEHRSIERSHRIDSAEFYRLLEGEVIDDVHLFAEHLQQWEDHYNYNRPHRARAGQTSYERLRQKMRNPLSGASVSCTPSPAIRAAPARAAGRAVQSVLPITMTLG